nr:reverse transcriptase domain-containing protein [Tanacetum cinerariifolium]
MPTKIELTLEQSQQGVSYDVLPRSSEVKVILSSFQCQITVWGDWKANVVADTLSRKEREQPLKVQALVMTIGLDLPRQILNAQTEARKP